MISFLKKSFKLNRLFFFYLILVSSIYPQVKRETRAVWVSTNFRLDWPPHSYNSQVQKSKLEEILDLIKVKNLNTVYFQVRSNGTVLFKSSFEPFSPYFTGIVGVMPDYDPLKFAVEQAHKRGLELHAWVNVIRCFAGPESYILKNPEHLFVKHPNWIVKYIKNGEVSYWLNPGLPAVRKYLTNLLVELAEKYNLDGIQLDYFRYPGKSFNDSSSYNKYGNGFSLDKWRRKNLTDLLAEIYKKIKKVKPYLKIGVTPLGIYKNYNKLNGLEGFSDVFQDTRAWLRKKITDYLTPQIYWALGGNPDFKVLAKEWIKNSFGRNIVLGIAAYKPEVRSQIDSIIAFSRNIGASGIAFFRYSNIKNIRFRLFNKKVLPSPMSWLSQILPLLFYKVGYFVKSY